MQKIILVPLSALIVLATFVPLPALATENIQQQLAATNLNIDRLWVIIAGCLVFLMQGGFLLFETGLVREKNTTATALKNSIDWVVVSLTFFFLGFGIMFGHSIGGLLGGSFFLLEGFSEADATKLGFALVFFHTAFVGTCLTIISGAMTERTGFIPYLVCSFFVGIFIYPVVGHWIWGDLVVADNQPWLASMGFIDFAGATVVHSVGAWVALVGVWMVGPRIGRYDAGGRPREFKAQSLAFSTLGVVILWFGWWGFNGGSTLSLNKDVGNILVNTNLAATASGLSAFFYSFFIQRKEDLYEKFLGGILGGLVAITACCHLVSPLAAIAIGLCAGIIHNISYDLVIKKAHLDDVVGAIPVHGICGIWGTLCVALFGQQSLLPLPRMEQLGVQAMGVLAVFIWSVSCAYIMFRLLRATVGLRVSPELEQEGLSIVKEFTQTEIEAVDEDLLKQLEAMAKAEANTDDH